MRANFLRAAIPDDERLYHPGQLPAPMPDAVPRAPLVDFSGTWGMCSSRGPDWRICCPLRPMTQILCAPLPLLFLSLAVLCLVLLCRQTYCPVWSSLRRRCASAAAATPLFKVCSWPALSGRAWHTTTASDAAPDGLTTGYAPHATTADGLPAATHGTMQHYQQPPRLQSSVYGAAELLSGGGAEAVPRATGAWSPVPLCVSKANPEGPQVVREDTLIQHPDLPRIRVKR